MNATIRLNGIKVVEPHDFHHSRVTEKHVWLRKANTIEVQLRSAPGTMLTVEIIGIDADRPTIEATVNPPPNAQGWNRSAVTVSFHCADRTSGIAVCPSPVLVDAEGSNHAVTGTAVDKAGSSASASVIVNLDWSPPGIAVAASPPPNPAGWNNLNVNVSFVCSDASSGIASCPAPVLVEVEGSNQTVTGTAADKAGNSASAYVTVNLDKAPPGIAATASPPANPAGWNNADVTVTFVCADPLSGMESCSTPVLVANEGGNQPVLGEARDKAGNTATAAASISLDKTPPSVTVTEPVSGGTVEQSPATIRGAATDAHSGVADVTCGGSAATFSAGAFNCDVAVPDGPNSIVVEARDLAGNAASLAAVFTANVAALELKYLDDLQTMDARFTIGVAPEEIRGGYVYYRPRTLPTGYYSLGDTAALPGMPSAFAMVARELKPGALAPPAGYKRGLAATPLYGTGYFLWRPAPPEGYVCLGMLVNPEEPGLDEMRCVRQDLVRAGTAGERMGNHGWNGYAQTPPASWQVIPAGDGVYSGQFAWSDAYGPPSGTLHTIGAHAVRAPRLSSADVVHMIETLGPAIRLNVDEQYLPDDPEAVLDGSLLQWGLVPTESDYGAFTQQLLGQRVTSAATLMSDVAVAQSDPSFGSPSFRTWIAIADARKPGGNARPRVLVRARPWNTVFTELQFWVYYPFNGPGKFEVTCGILFDAHVEMQYPGRHYSDWEHVSYLVQGRDDLVSLYISRHDLNVWVNQKDFGSITRTSQGFHPVIYAARDSHAHYLTEFPEPPPGVAHSTWGLPYKRVKHSYYYVCTLDVDLVDWTGGAETPLQIRDLNAFDPEIYRFVSSEVPGAAPTSPEPAWLQFAGRWGQYEKLSETFYFAIAGYPVYAYPFEEVGAGPSGPAMKTSWKKGDWCMFSGTC